MFVNSDDGVPRYRPMTTRVVDVDQLLLQSRVRRSLPEPAVRRLLRERAQLSQEQVAGALGVARSAVTRWELGQRSPRGDLLGRYVTLLDRLAAER